MHWIGKILLLLLLQSLTLLKAKRRKREAKEAVDPLLSLVFSTPEHKDVPKVRDTRPDRAISPDEELAALLDAVDKRTKNKHANIQEKRSAVYPQVPNIPSQVTDSTQASITPSSTGGASTQQAPPEMQSISELMNANTRSTMPEPEPMTHWQQPVVNPNPQEMENAGLTPRRMPLPMAQPVPFQPIKASSVADVPAQQTVPGFSSSFASNSMEGFAFPGQQAAKNTTLERKSTVTLPGSNTNKPDEGITFFIPDSKKSSIPIPVRMETRPVIINKDSEPIQLRKISPNMRLRGIVPHNPEYAADECEDQYPMQCVDYAKHKYCVNFEDLMRVQCRRSCGFCVPQKETTSTGKTKTIKSTADQESSGSASGSGSGTMASGSGEEDTEGYSSRMETNKSRKDQIVYLPELGSGSGGSGSGSGDSRVHVKKSKTIKHAKKHAHHKLSVKSEILNSSSFTNNTERAEVVKNEELADNASQAEVPSKNKASIVDKAPESISAPVKKFVIPQVAIAQVSNKAMPTAAAGASSESGSGSGSGEESGSGNTSGSGDSEKESAKAVPAKPKIPEKRLFNISKKAIIPKAPQDLLKRLSTYPRIDLKVIASALAKYEEAALQMAAEYPRFIQDPIAEVERSNIPKPSAFGEVKVDKMKQDIQVAKLSTQTYDKRFEIPKYLIVGEDIHEKGGVAKEQTPLEDAASYQSVSERFKVAGKQPNLMEFYAETGKTSFDQPGARRSKIDKRKKLRPVDPYEYLRNMAPGASMEPIADPKARSSVPVSHSYPLFLMKVSPDSAKYVAEAKPRSSVQSKPFNRNPMQDLQQHFVAPPPAHVAPQPAQQAAPPAPAFPLPATNGIPQADLAPPLPEMESMPQQIAPPPAQLLPQQAAILPKINPAPQAPFRQPAPQVVARPQQRLQPAVARTQKAPQQPVGRVPAQVAAKAVPAPHNIGQAPQQVQVPLIPQPYLNNQQAAQQLAAETASIVQQQQEQQANLAQQEAAQAKQGVARNPLLVSP